MQTRIPAAIVANPFSAVAVAAMIGTALILAVKALGFTLGGVNDVLSVPVVVGVLAFHYNLGKAIAKGKPALASQSADLRR